MIKYKVKSLLDAMDDGEVNIIAHQANCFHRMGSGIAPLIAAKWPQVREVDRQTPNGDLRKLGSVSRAEVGKGFVYNLYGQYYPGRNTDYEALRESLQKMSKDLIGLEGVKIGLPKIGCGIGGGDWTVVSKLIEEELWWADVTVYVLNQSEIPAEQ